ncbi:MAG: alpha/beta hydrolase [Actinobacteria bacterium]|nr:alpha/beta hydrolase [Actinomycetota bacterium]
MESGLHERFAEVSCKRICCVDKGEGRAILSVHDLGSKLANWEPTVKSLSQDFRVIAVDMPGCGKSDFFDTGFTPDSFSGVILSLLDLLRVERVTVAGHSMGGVIILNLALFCRDRINGLVLVDAAGSFKIPGIFRTQFSSTASANLNDRMSRLLSDFERSRMFMKKHRFIQHLTDAYHSNGYTEYTLTNGIDLLKGRDIREFIETLIRSVSDTGSFSYRSMLGEIDVPTLMVSGRIDFPSVKIGQRMIRAIKGLVMALIPDTGHNPHLEQPDLFNDTLRKFLLGAFN